MKQNIPSYIENYLYTAEQKHNLNPDRFQLDRQKLNVKT